MTTYNDSEQIRTDIERMRLEHIEAHPDDKMSSLIKDLIGFDGWGEYMQKSMTMIDAITEGLGMTLEQAFSSEVTTALVVGYYLAKREAEQNGSD